MSNAQYCVVSYSGSTSDVDKAFAALVERKLRDGWKCQGGVSVVLHTSWASGVINLSQAMLKEDSE